MGGLSGDELLRAGDDPGKSTEECLMFKPQITLNRCSKVAGGDAKPRRREAVSGSHHERKGVAIA